MQALSPAHFKGAANANIVRRSKKNVNSRRVIYVVRNRARPLAPVVQVLRAEQSLKAKAADLFDRLSKTAEWADA